MVAKANPYYSLLFYSAKCRRAFGRNQKLANAYSRFSLFIVSLDVKLTFSSPKCKYQLRRSRYSALMFGSILLDQSSLLSFCPDFQSPFLVCNNVTWQQCLLTKQQSVFTYRATLGTRGFSRVRRDLSAKGRHSFGRRPKPRATKPREKLFARVTIKT